MKRTFTLILSVLISSFFFQSIAQQTAKVTPDGIGYYEYLPDGYRSNTDKYPVVIFLHGYKEKGTSSTDPKLVLRDLPRAAYVALPRYVKQGKKYPFILITPQLKRQYSSWPPSYVMQVLNHVKKTLRIDERRIYLTGLSLGGFGVWKTAGEYPGVFAAIGPLCAGANAMDKAHALARENVAVWAFHGGSDRVVSHSVTTRMVSAINSAPKKPNPLAKVTIFPGMDHNIWDKAYQQTDLLRWMLTVRNGGSENHEPPSSNKPPVANAGESKTITLPEDAVHIKGSGADSDGSIVSYKWTKVSGANAKLEQTDKPELRVSDLIEGTYVFRLTVKDSDGDSDSDDMTLTVKPEANREPVADAGSDRTLTLPDNRISLVGSAKDPDGEIKSYAWKKLSGIRANLTGTSSKTLQVSDLVAGTYVFQLTVTDNDGKSGSDVVTVTVKEEATKPEENKSPVVKLGGDRSIRLPNNRLVINASATDEDGTIRAFEWVQVSGSGVNISGVRSATLVVSGLRQGQYVFQVVVTDDKGAKDVDDIRVTVLPEEKKPDEQIVEGGEPDETEHDIENKSPEARELGPVIESTPKRISQSKNKGNTPVADRKWLRY